MAAIRTPTADERMARTPFARKLMARPELGAVAGTILVFLFFGIVAGGSGLFSPAGIINFLEVSAQLGIIAVAASMLMIGGEFDLSIGSMIGAAGVIIAIPAVQWGWPLWLCILLAFAIACLIGYINGQIVIRSGLPSFIVTLAGLFILRGLTIGFTRWITGRTQVSGLKSLAAEDWLAPVFAGEVGQTLMVWLANLGVIGMRADGAPAISGISMSIVWWLILTAAATYILLRTRVGNWIFAAGGDPNAARNVGVPVAAVKTGLFMFTACAATLFACVQVLDAGSADTTRGLLKEFEAIIAAVIGGCLLTGGYGSVVGAALGALIFGVVQQGLFFAGAESSLFRVFLGTILILAVIMNTFIRRMITGER